MSTIYALSSGHGKCGVAVVRISGSNAQSAITAMTKPSSVPAPRMAVLRSICHPCTKELLDRGLVLWFPGRGSFTGEDCVELQVHGGAAVLAAVTGALACLPGFRHALPGEFTRRAFSNGKLDLTGVEGLADLLSAETEAQRKQALRQSCGSLASLYQRWQQQLLEVRAIVEAYLDFGEEGHEEMPQISGEVGKRVKTLCETMSRHLCDGRRGEILRAGVQLCIVGRPNVGKSSLLNVLLQRPAAIVSHLPGTTRDIVSGTLDIGGYPVKILDSAGLRDGADIVEEEGIRRAVQSAIDSDAAIVVVEASQMVSRLRKCGDRETDCESDEGKSIDLRVLENGVQDDLGEMGVNTAFGESERVRMKNFNLSSENINKVNFNVEGNCDVSKTNIKNPVLENHLNLYNNQLNPNRKINYLNYSEKVRFVVLDLLSELFKDKLSLMRWFQESNFLVLVNKIDLLDSHDKDYLSSCLALGTTASGNIFCPKLGTSTDTNHFGDKFNSVLVSATSIHDLALPYLKSSDDGSNNRSGDGSNNRSGDGINNTNVDGSYKNSGDDSNNSRSSDSYGDDKGNDCVEATLVLSSLLHNAGVDELLLSLTELCKRLCWSGDADHELPSITSARHRAHVADALECLLTILGEQGTQKAMSGGNKTASNSVSSVMDGAYSSSTEHKDVCTSSRTLYNQDVYSPYKSQSSVSWEDTLEDYSTNTNCSPNTDDNFDSSDPSTHLSNSHPPLQKFGASANSVDPVNLLEQESTRVTKEVTLLRRGWSVLQDNAPTLGGAGTCNASLQLSGASLQALYWPHRASSFVCGRSMSVCLSVQSAQRLVRQLISTDTLAWTDNTNHKTQKNSPTNSE
ncbi:tRNA modification GTPase MnmE [Trinorchestia longiramus]|nr:tRNA modification GTPase MnmE [Trinorchestia longiramus]